jgi:thiamine-phosphate pyrophosphorylase
VAGPSDRAPRSSSRHALPRLHVVTDDAVLARASFPEQAAALLAIGALALHLRGHATPAATLFSLAEQLAATTTSLRGDLSATTGATGPGPLLLVNDRIDVALAAGADGVQVGVRSLPAADARRLVGPRWLGYSAHSANEVLRAQSDGTDFVVLGTIYPSASHAGVAPAGLDLVLDTAARVRVPVVAIGGVTIERVAPVMRAGAHGVAVLSGVWSATDPAAAARRYLDAIDAAVRTME